MVYYFSETRPESDSRHTVRYRRTKAKEIIIRDSFGWETLRGSSLIFSVNGTDFLFDGKTDAETQESLPAARHIFDKFKIKTEEYNVALDAEQTGTMSKITLDNAERYVICLGEKDDTAAFHYCLDEIPSYGAGLARCVQASGDSMLSYSTRVRCVSGSDVVLWDAMSRLHGELIKLIRLNTDGIINEYDSEFLHDFRVSVRRLRSAMSIVKGAFTKEYEDRFRGRFSYLGELTGRARDMDVYLDEIEGYKDMLPDSLRPGMDSVKEYFTGIRREEYDRLKEYISSGEFMEMLDRWATITSSRGEIGPKGFVKVEKAAAKAIKKSFMLADRLTAAICRESGVQDIHGVRIAFKKLRYCVEFFSGIIKEDRAEAVLANLRALQDSLGRYNDLNIQCGHISDVLIGETDPKTAAACGYILSVLTEEKKDEREKCLELIKDFRDDKKYIMKMLRI